MENNVSFEVKMQRLEEIVEKINSSDLQLDKALKLFEEGVKLVNELSTDLKEARGKIAKFNEILNSEEPFDVSEN
jgi:exodeoxyribonuclease VII small subunit